MNKEFKEQIENARSFFELTMELNDGAGDKDSATVESAKTALLALQITENVYALFDTLHEKMQVFAEKDGSFAGGNESYAAGLLAAENLLVEALDVFEEEEKEREAEVER